MIMHTKPSLIHERFIFSILAKRILWQTLNAANMPIVCIFHIKYCTENGYHQYKTLRLKPANDIAKLKHGE